jgi:drug/metabolite transporter (DMT)-like permease
MDRSSVIILLISAFFAATGQVLFKIGANGRTVLLDFINPPILAGLVMYAASTILWIYVLSEEKLVNVYVFTALSFALVYLAGVLVLGENISIGGVFGVLLVLSGLYLIITYGS